MRLRGLDKVLPHASWESLDAAHRRKILDTLIERVQYDHRQGGGILTVTLKGTRSIHPDRGQEECVR
jgi:hypothetical protein